MGGGEEEGGAGGGLEGGGGPAGLHEAGIGVGVGAEEEVAEFMGDNVAEHVAFPELVVIGAGGKILVIDIGIDSGAGFIEEGLAEGFRRDGDAALQDANGQVMWPGDCGAGRRIRRKVQRVDGWAIKPVQFKARLKEDGGSAISCLGQNGR